MTMLRTVVVGVIFLMVFPGSLSRSEMEQQGQPMQNPGLNPPGRSPNGENDPMPRRIEEKQEQARNSERQKRLVADTDKLLALATDLKAQVDKTNKDTLSMDVIKKADEIEKLAHSVKERMKG
jgi:nitric oxide reductase activation protein